jgi:hypothetical protein
MRRLNCIPLPRRRGKLKKKRVRKMGIIIRNVVIT